MKTKTDSKSSKISDEHLDDIQSYKKRSSFGFLVSQLHKLRTSDSKKTPKMTSK